MKGALIGILFILGHADIAECGVFEPGPPPASDPTFSFEPFSKTGSMVCGFENMRGFWTVTGSVTLTGSLEDCSSRVVVMNPSNEELCTIDLKECSATVPEDITDVCVCTSADASTNEYGLHIRRRPRRSETEISLSAVILSEDVNGNPTPVVATVGTVPKVHDVIYVTYKVKDLTGTVLQSVRSLLGVQTIKVPAKTYVIIEFCTENLLSDFTLAVIHDGQTTSTQDECITHLTSYDFDEADSHRLKLEYEEPKRCKRKDSFQVDVEEDKS